MIKRAANKRKRSLCWNGLISDDAYKCILSLGFLQKINLEDRALYTSKKCYKPVVLDLKREY